MHPSHPRWQPSHSQRDRSATFWKIVVAATSGAALSAVIVVSCLTGDHARSVRDDEPGVVVTTTSATMPTPSVATLVPATTVVLGPTAAPVSIEVPTPVAPAVVMAEPEVASRAAAPPVLASMPDPAPVAASMAPAATAEVPVAAEAAPVAPPQEPVAGAADAGAPVTPPAAPPEPVIGAGRFSTDAPPWSASSWQSDPNAGAGRFTTEWNIPGYGYWPY